MGCFFSSPHQSRKYRSPSKKDEDIVYFRTFGTFRNNSVLIPDDIDGLPSTKIHSGLASDENECLYKVVFDQGRPWRCLRPIWLFAFPYFWAWVAAVGLAAVFRKTTCDEAFCWVRKEYSTRTFLRIFPNRIEVNKPYLRWPWGVCGCGSWNADEIEIHSFDRGAFGFRAVNSKTISSFCCIWPIYGGVVARQRCPCNGSVWPRLFSDCGGCWCDEWICDACCCSYRYGGLANPDEVAFASSIALQAYFEGRVITKSDMNKCIEYWRENISEETSPLERRRPVCCEPVCIPICTCQFLHEHCCHCKRQIPYGSDDVTEELQNAYDDYNTIRLQNIQDYKTFYGPVRNSTICRACGCRRVFGRRGFIFCTEGCRDCCGHKKGDPAPPFYHQDVDDDNDASRILQIVLGEPPEDVVITRRERDSFDDCVVRASQVMGKDDCDFSLRQQKTNNRSNKTIDTLEPITI